MKKLTYSIDELAAVSSLSAPKIRKDIRNGILRTVPRGTRQLIPYSEVEKYLGLTDSAGLIRVSSPEEFLSTIELIK